MAEPEAELHEWFHLLMVMVLPKELAAEQACPLASEHHEWFHRAMELWVQMEPWLTLVLQSLQDLALSADQDLVLLLFHPEVSHPSLVLLMAQR